MRSLTLETYAALFARNSKRTKKALDVAAYKGFAAETCSFLRVLEGIDLPKPDFGVSTSQPCQQGERIFQDLARQYGFTERFYSLHTPVSMNDDNAVETIAEGLETAVGKMEKAVVRPPLCLLFDLPRKTCRPRFQNPSCVMRRKVLY